MSSEDEMSEVEEKMQPTGPSLDDYHGVMSKANKQPNRHKKRMDVAKAKKLKAKLKKEERRRKQREADALGEDAPPRQVPKTLETLREHDSTMVDKNSPEDMALDEFTSYFEKSYVPKVLITSSANPNLKTRLFLKEMERVIPNSTVFHRRQAKIKNIVNQAKDHEFTDIVVINEDRKEPSSMLICHLPEGPTCFFRLSNVKLTKHIKRDWREITSHRPEVLWSNFRTRLGVGVGRMFASLFHYEPQFKGRRIVTFHNQRDYIFFRHHRYEFKKDGSKAALRELGPRFTLKLRSVQKGTFESKTGEYQWIITNKRHKMEASRRRFHL
ncbi:putative ribosome production factor 1 [Orchesella cincta]|uniref:Putative ribosome production factor 1 n=1 Tax=Orchesella cincta TaxID=48709 RepID=A0A1D2N607_ORCCI|nr:putative ribosome production factor 1 [Orchesella cincta]